MSAFPPKSPTANRPSSSGMGGREAVSRPGELGSGLPVARSRTVVAGLVPLTATTYRESALHVSFVRWKSASSSVVHRGFTSNRPSGLASGSFGLTTTGSGSLGLIRIGSASFGLGDVGSFGLVPSPFGVLGLLGLGTLGAVSFGLLGVVWA